MSYTYTYLETRLNAALKNKAGILISAQDTINAGVREAYGETMFRGAKRKVQLSPKLFSNVYSYPAPQDLNGIAITDIQPNNQEDQTGKEVILRTPDEFWQNFSTFNCSVDDTDSYKKILISLPVDDTSLVVSKLDALDSGGGTWGAFDSQTTNVRVDTSNYMKGTASLSFDINTVSGTTAGVVNSTLTSFDYSSYVYGSIFVWAYITSKTDITNFKIRVGNNASSYYEMTATSTHESIPFQNGWNLLRFDMSSKTTVGSPTSTAGRYIALFMTKATTKISEVGYAFDHIMFKTGKAYMLTYYTQYPWRNSSGTYLLESTTSTDTIVCNTDEIDIILNKIISIAAEEIGDDAIRTLAEAKYKSKRDIYLTNNPDESKSLISTYYVFE